jgi:hypothetical protein
MVTAMQHHLAPRCDTSQTRQPSFTVKLGLENPATSPTFSKPDPCHFLLFPWIKKPLRRCWVESADISRLIIETHHLSRDDFSTEMIICHIDGRSVCEVEDM